jgi:release factor glutamine methyltransferase
LANETVSVKEALELGAAILRSADPNRAVIDRPRLEAEILLGFFTNLSRTELITKRDQTIDRKEFFKLIEKRKNFYPIEYITGKVSFYSREFFCEEGVLIPRPETEILVDKVLEIADCDRDITIAEIGSGNGAISVTIACELKKAKIIATDINEKAIELSRKNAAKFGVENRVKFIHTNLLDNIDEKIDILISNPPYIKDGFKLPKNVNYEPKNALFAGSDGAEVLRQIIALRKRPLICECGFDQEKILAETLTQNGYNDFSFYRDYANLTRGFIAK